MGVEYGQSNLTSGELTPVLHARIDLNTYANGVSNAENMVILPHGGMRRRPGMSKITDTQVPSDARLSAFVFNKTQKYIVLFRPGFIDVYRDGVIVAASITSPYSTQTIINELDTIQSADTMIITHETVPPYRLQRQGSDTSWLFEPIAFTEAPTFLFDAINATYTNTGVTQVIAQIDPLEIVFDQPNNKYYRAQDVLLNVDLATEDYTVLLNWEDITEGEPAWSNTRGYPAVCTFHQNRLWFAGSTQLPTSIWGSKISGFFDFGLGTSLADDAIADTLDTDQYNKITNIFSGRQLQVFTTGGEFNNAAPIITPTDSEWRKQTGYGSKRVRPILIDGATLFVDSSERTIRQYLYDDNEGDYVSLNLSILSSHLISNVVAMDAIKGTQYDVGDYVYVINEDGTCAVLNTMRNQDITGWTHWVTDGNFKDVVVLDKEVYFLVERKGNFFIELLTEDTYTDHNVIERGTQPTTSNIVDGLNNIVFNGDNIVFTDTSTGTPITELVTDYDATFATTEFKVIADYSIMDDALYEGTDENNKFTITRVAYRLEVGLNFKTTVETLPMSTETQKGITLYRRKRIVKVDINVFESLGVYARNRIAPDRQFAVVLDQAPIPFTGFREMYLLGYDRLTTIVIGQEEPLPFILIGLGTEVAY